MKLADLLPSVNLLQDAENVEGGLRQARSLGRTGGWIGVLASFATILFEVLRNSARFGDVKISWAIYLMAAWLWLRWWCISATRS